MAEGDRSEMQEKQGQINGLFRTGASDGVAAANPVGACRGCRRAGIRQYYVYSEVIMKVVLIENPRLIAGLLRKMFGIKREKQNVV